MNSTEKQKIKKDSQPQTIVKTKLIHSKKLTLDVISDSLDNTIQKTGTIKILTEQNQYIRSLRAKKLAMLGESQGFID